ncbi:MAG: hypothetical protein ACP5PM_04335 [Acidimicrobiales bacterium]
MPRAGWTYSPRWDHYYSAELDRDEVTKETKAMLAKATKGDAWTDPKGRRHIPLLVDDQIVGNLWEDADLAGLDLAGYWAVPNGVHAELASGQRIVGTIWVGV